MNLLTSYDLDPQTIAKIISTISAILGSIIYIWRKIIRPLFKIFKSNEKILESINDIKKELSTNGGSSLKDAIVGLQTTCKNIEQTQKVMEQRSRSSLNFSDAALFETDVDGNLIWYNEKFLELTEFKYNELQGYDWMSKIESSQRTAFLKEFQSCLEMSRKFESVASLDDDRQLKFVGFPIKIGDNEHHGFLFNVTLI